MANKQQRYTSRSNRPNKSNRTNKILNALIGIVVVLIVITAGFIFLGNDDSQKADNANDTQSSRDESEKAEESNSSTQDVANVKEKIGSEEIKSEEEGIDAAEDENPTKKEETTTEDPITGGTVTSTPTDDPLISEKIVNTAWKPIGTSQTGQHTSSYSEGHVDWNEKVKALAYTTGLSAENMIVWRIENGGGPQKSIGVVSSKNKEEKYRVAMQWVDNEGWKPEKMETLKTLDGAY